MAAIALPSEEFAQHQLALQPLFNGAVRLLGQVSGLLLLANAGSDLDRQRHHVNRARLHWRELREGCHDLARSRAAASVGQSIERIGALLDRLERRFSQCMRDDAELSAMLGELAGIRWLLHGASCPQHGLALVDFSGACCAGAH